MATAALREVSVCATEPSIVWVYIKGESVRAPPFLFNGNLNQEVDMHRRVLVKVLCGETHTNIDGDFIPCDCWKWIETSDKEEGKEEGVSPIPATLEEISIEDIIF